MYTQTYIHTEESNDNFSRLRNAFYWKSELSTHTYSHKSENTHSGRVYCSTIVVPSKFTCKYLPSMRRMI